MHAEKSTMQVVQEVAEVVTVEGKYVCIVSLTILEISKISTPGFAVGPSGAGHACRNPGRLNGIVVGWMNGE